MPRTKKVAEAVTATENTTAVETSAETKTSRKKTSTKKAENKPLYEEKYMITMWFVQPLLGSAPSDPDLYKRFIASNAPDAPTREEELLTNTVENVAAKGVNIFLRRTKTGIPCVGQHTVKGYFKESMTASRRQEGSVSEGLSGHKTKITGNTVIKPTFINLKFPEELVTTKTEEEFTNTGFGQYAVVKFPKQGRFERHMLPTCDRPLQAETAKGKITSIASSEMAPAGTSIEYELTVEMKGLSEGLFDVLKRGINHGTGQWRGSGEYGGFLVEIRDSNGKFVDGNTKEVLGATSDEDDFQDKLWDYIDENTL